MRKSAAVQKCFHNQRMNNTVHDFLNLSTGVGHSSENTDGGNPLFSDAFWDELFSDDSANRMQQSPSSNISGLQRPRSPPHPATASRSRAQKIYEAKMAQLISERAPRWPNVIERDLIALVSGYIRIHCFMDPPYDLVQLCSVYTMSEMAAKEHWTNTHEAKLKAWEYEGGYERRNVRTLIGTLSDVLPKELLKILVCSKYWKGISASNTATLKRGYFKCIRVVHPDKSSQRRDCMEWQVICDYVFQALKQAYKAEVV